MIITVIGDRGSYSTDEVLDAIAVQFNVNSTSFSLRRSGMAEFILLGADDAAMTSLLAMVGRHLVQTPCSYTAVAGPGKPTPRRRSFLP